MFGIEIVVRNGTFLEHRLLVRTGHIAYIPTGIPRLPTDGRRTETAITELARTDHHAEGSTVLIPELDGRIGSQGAPTRS